MADKKRGRKDALTQEQRHDIILRAIQGESKIALAEEYGVTRSWVYDMVERALTDPQKRLKEAEADVVFRRQVGDILASRDGLRDMHSEMNRMMAEASGRMPQVPTTESTGWAPAVDVVTRGNDMLIKAELPGMKREDVDVSLKGVLTISGERKAEEEHKESGYLIKERRYGSFSRSITLPEVIDESKIKASFKDGLLEVTVERAGTQVEEGPRRIEIEG